jgi:Sodium/calcium exchanger protein
MPLFPSHIHHIFRSLSFSVMAECHYSLLQKPFLCFLLFSYPLFLLISPAVKPLPSASSSSPFPARFLLQSPQSCTDIPIDYRTIHSCFFGGNPRLSLPFLALVLLLYFRFLALAAGRHFTPAVSQLVDQLRLSPSMAGVTLLALGNGAPDAFSSAAALRSGLPRTGDRCILLCGYLGLVEIQFGY